MSVVVAVCCVLIVLLAIYAAGLYLATLSFIWARWRGRRGAQDAPSTTEPPDHADAITVIVPARNEGPMVLRAIQSLLDQDTRARVAIHLLVKDRGDSSWPFLQSAFGLDPADDTGLASIVVFESGGSPERTFAGPRSVTIGFVGEDGKADKINWLVPRLTTPLVAVLDADHQAHPDWLRRSVGRMRSRGAKMIQGRRHGLVASGLFSLWDSLHQHVGCELYNTTFAHFDLSVFFTGTTVVAETALLQRHPLRVCITEDIDLSYTLFMEGERLVADPHGGSDEEVSPDLYSFLARRRRWANGHTDAFVRHLSHLGRAPLRLRDRVQFLFHGLHYLVAALVFVLQFLVGVLFAAELPAGALLASLGLGVFAAVAVAKTQHTTGWRTRASEVVVLTGWFLPAAVMVANLVVALLLGDASRLSPPLPDVFIVVGLFALLAPLVVLLAGLAGFGMLTPTTALVVTVSYPVAFYLDIAGVLIGLADYLAGRSLWQVVARAATIALPRVRRVRSAEVGRPVGTATIRASIADGVPTLALAQGPGPAALELTDTERGTDVGLTGVSLSPVISIPETWRMPAILALFKRTLAMALPRRGRPVRLVIWLSLLGLVIGGFIYSRATRLTVAAAACEPLPHDDYPWVVQAHHLPGYCAGPAPAEGERWSRRRSDFEPVRVDTLSPPDLSYWQKLDSTFECNLVRFDPDNIVPTADPGGGIDLVLRKEATTDRGYTSGSLGTHDRKDAEHRFGRFEVVMKAARGEGLITAFFLHRRDPWQEIDIEILGRDTTKLLANVYFNPGVDGDLYNYGFSGTPTLIDLGFDAAADFHRYAIEWDVDELRWFVDDRLVHRRRAGRPTPIPHLPMRLYTNLWATCSEALAGPFDPTGTGAGLPAVASIASIAIARRESIVLHPIWSFYDGLFSDGPDGPGPEPEPWQDQAEWLQRHRPTP